MKETNPYALKFNLNGKLACFRKPETNADTFLTYSCIHKVALLGILGSIIGLGGYNQIKREKGKIILPEFYEKLKNLKIAIVAPRKNIIQQTITFNNATGIASKEEGGNLIVKETVLNNPSWDIFILNDNSEEFEKLCDYILNSKSKFIPYLGRTDYFANISNAKLVNLEEVEKDTVTYNSLVEGDFEDLVYDYDEEDEDTTNDETEFLSLEHLPISLNKDTAHYNYTQFLNTNNRVKKKKNTYMHDKKILFFY